MSEINEFWKSVRKLVCPCGLWDCGSKNCELVQYMNNEENKKQVRTEDRTSTKEK